MKELMSNNKMNKFLQKIVHKQNKNKQFWQTNIRSCIWVEKNEQTTCITQWNRLLQKQIFLIWWALESPISQLT